MIKLLVLASLVTLSALASLFVLQSRPVVYRYYEAGNPIKEPAFVIFNPFRDRRPEKSAAEFLQRLKWGLRARDLRVE